MASMGFTIDPNLMQIPPTLVPASCRDDCCPKDIFKLQPSNRLIFSVQTLGLCCTGTRVKNWFTYY